MTKKANKTRIVILAIACLAFVTGMIFYKTCNLSENIPEEEKIEKLKEPKSKPSVKSPKKEIVTPVTPVDTPQIEAVAAIEEPEPEMNPVNDENPGTIVFEQNEEVKELTNIYIPLTKSLFKRSNLLINDLPSGKIYYSGVNGKLKISIVHRDGKTFEYLTSYNIQGEKMDFLEIGLIDENSVRKYAILSQNKISTFEIIQDNGKKGEENVINYSITPELRFVKGKTYKKVL
jgi:hypothetical protein